MPRSLNGQLVLPPPDPPEPPVPPPPPAPPPVPLGQVLGPALLPPGKPPLEIPSQQVPKLAQAEPQEDAPSMQRLLMQRRELTGGPLLQSQYQ